MDVSMLDAAPALAVGAVLGLWFFGGLLWTVRRLPAARRPLLLLLASFLVRTAGVAAGVVWLAGRHWLAPVLALAGFLAIRFWMLRAWGRLPLESPARQE